MKRLTHYLIVCGCLLLMVACARTGDSNKSSSKNLQLAFITNNSADFWTIARRGTEKADAVDDVTVEFKIPSDGTAAEQKRPTGVSL